MNPHYQKTKQTVDTIPKKGEVLSVCASLNEDYICCGVHVLRMVSNCPFDCTYCFLQGYLTNSHMSVIDDISSVMDDVKKLISFQPWRFFRIGTWELGDSLALEALSGQAERLILEFSSIPQALLELKTKSDCVDSLLKLPHHQRTVISWSLNPSFIIETEERGTARLSARLDAMRKVVDAGYLTALHFDPMIFYDHWEADYEALVARIFEKIPSNRIAWISIGSLRFNPEMKAIMEYRFPQSPLTLAEMVLGPDRKMRYVKPLRIQIYRSLNRFLQKYRSEPIFTYLCMERWDVWDQVFGEHPLNLNEQSYRLTLSLWKRFGGLVQSKPLLRNYF